MSSLMVVYCFRSRSFLCSISTAFQYIFAAIATKTYYTIETLLSLSGAPFFYGIITLIGYKLDIIVVFQFRNIKKKTEK